MESAAPRFVDGRHSADGLPGFCDGYCEQTVGQNSIGEGCPLLVAERTIQLNDCPHRIDVGAPHGGQRVAGR
jgi:hypothetical protein